MEPVIAEVPVLIAGAGPAGLMTASTLAAHGVGCLVVERRTHPPSLPRATVLTTRTMELLRGFGLEQAVCATGPDVDWTLLESETLAQAAAGRVVRVGLPTREQAALLSPTAPACVPQDALEPLLAEHVRGLGVRVETGAEVTRVTLRPGAVDAEVRRADGAASRTVRARYVVGADGARSAVRAALGIALRGPAELMRGVTALVHAPLWELVGDRRHGIYTVTSPGAEGTFLPAGPGERWAYGASFRPGHEQPLATGAAAVEARLRRGVGVERLPLRVVRTGTFSAGAQLADRFRRGNAFLVGDAAHRVTPRGGTGLNTAMHDGHDLGWRLSLVLRGLADEALLDGYETGRRAVAAHNAARSADPLGSRRDPADELHADLGGRMPHLWLGGASLRVSTLDVLGTGFTLFAGPDADPAGTAAAALPLAVRMVDELAARALGLARDGALLVRPDALPVALWRHAPPAAAVERAVRDVLAGREAARQHAAR
jgi:putative polyketide hydroxylase